MKNLTSFSNFANVCLSFLMWRHRAVQNCNFLFLLLLKSNLTYPKTKCKSCFKHSFFANYRLYNGPTATTVNILKLPGVAQKKWRIPRYPYNLRNKLGFPKFGEFESVNPAFNMATAIVALASLKISPRDFNIAI